MGLPSRIMQISREEGLSPVRLRVPVWLFNSRMFAFDAGFPMQRWQRFRCCEEHYIEGQSIGRLKRYVRMWLKGKVARR